jgi:hypothetical protein
VPVKSDLFFVSKLGKPVFKKQYNGVYQERSQLQKNKPPVGGTVPGKQTVDFVNFENKAQIRKELIQRSAVNMVNTKCCITLGQINTKMFLF